MNTSKYRYFLMITINVLFVALYLTSPVDDLPSMSFSHGKENEPLYLLMHFNIAFFLWSKFKQTNENAYFWAANGIALIASISMFLGYLWHSIFTVATMALALFTIVYIAKTKHERNLRLILVALAVIIAVTTYIFRYVSFFWGEAWVVDTVMFALLREELYGHKWKVYQDWKEQQKY